MSVKFTYAAYIIALHLILAGLLYEHIRENHDILWLLPGEGLLLLSLFFAYRIFRRFMRPLEISDAGAAALQDRDFQVKFLRTGAPEPDKIIDLYNRMIDNLRTERTETREKHYFLEQVLENSASGIVLTDFDGKIDYVNPKIREWFGVKDTLEKSFAEVGHSFFDLLQNLPDNASETIQPPGASKRYRVESSDFTDRGFKRKFLLIEDVSEEILQAEKRAYEKVIRMMAHEVNNSIGAINSVIQTTIDFEKEEPRDFSEDIVYSLEVAKDRNDRLNLFMRNFADIIRLPAPAKEPVSLHKVVRDTAQLMTPAAAEKGIKIITDLDATDWQVNLDVRQFEQVLVNVIKNATEAIGTHGEIRLLSNYKRNELIIRDNGKGIAPEDAKKIFTPFYSNKTEGQGIGLTLTREILSGHGFDFALYSVDGFTDFKIVFNF